jgi:hypothetical protein
MPSNKDVYKPQVQAGELQQAVERQTGELLQEFVY